MSTARSPAARLVSSWSPHQVVGTPFLPAVTPEQRLPPGYARLAVLEAGIPDALNGSGPGARAWVDDGLRGLTADGFPEPGALPPRTLDRLLTCTTVLGHAYRWDRIPSPSRDFHLDHLDLPVALETVWRRAAAARGIPMVGTLWTLLLANWRLEGVAAGTAYQPDALQQGPVSLLANFLPGRRGEELTRFVVTFLRSEAVGADCLRLLVPLVEAAECGDADRASPLLEALPGQVKRLVTVFLEQIDPRHMDPNAWLDHIQRPYVWGVVDAQTGLRHEGPSGMQLGVMSLLNSLLDVQSHSALAQSIRSSWTLLLPEQRRFLEACEACRPVLRRFVSAPGRRRLRSAFNGTLDQLAAWRRCHQSRGTRYFQGSGEGPTMEASTGLVVDGGSNLLTHFLKAMEERLVETHQSRLLLDEGQLTDGEQALVALIKESLDDDNLIDDAEAAELDKVRATHGVSAQRLQQLLSDRRLKSSFPRRDQVWLRAVHEAARHQGRAALDWEALRAQGLASGIAASRLDLLVVLVTEALELEASAT